MAKALLPSEEPAEDGLPKEPTEKTTFGDEAVGRLIEQYRDKVRMQALLSSYSKQVQDLEKALFEVIENRYLPTAVGVQLDILGDLVGQRRGALSDTDYKVFIEARILVNRSSGHPDELIAIVQKLADPAVTSVITYEEYYPATICISLLPIGVRDPQAIADMISEAKPGGVQTFFKWSVVDDGLQFQFAEGVTPETSILSGFADGVFGGELINMIKV